MAVGDQAVSAGYQIVPNEGSEEAKVRYGATEINRTRDYIAQVRSLIPVNAAGYRTKAGIRYGSAPPSGGADGDIYLQIF